MSKRDEFYKFVKKDGWGFDIIEADADGLWQWIEEYAIEMCEKQIKICADEYNVDDLHYLNILHSPLPKELK